MQPPTPRGDRLRSAMRSEAGFSLIEASVALVISIVIFTALGAMLGASMNSAQRSRLHAQATQLAVESIEIARSFEWNELAMDATQAGDTRLSGGKLLATAVDIPADEDVLVDATDGKVQSKFPVVIDGQVFDVWQYVTDVETDRLKRIVIVVTWDYGGHVSEEHTSTLIAVGRYLP